MQSPVTGHRTGATTAVRCIDVAALVAAAFVRQNAQAGVIPFENHAVEISLNPRDSVMTNAQKLASIGGGGTNCSTALAELNRRGAKGNLVIYVSDNESWMDSSRYGALGSATATMKEWSAYKSRNAAARLVCIDIQPHGTTQAAERADILNIGGFSDRVFDVIREFANGTLNAQHWIGVIEAVNL
jgi:60 kDa SS-A/Ro ribonucleoprotein